MNKKPDSLSGILLVNKPKGMTSFDVIRILKKETKIQKIGHGGTLDKNASGLLIIGLGDATKRLEQILHLEKTYVFHMVFGVGSDTHDWLGHKWYFKTVPDLLQEESLRTLLRQKYTGEILQIPPLYSSIKKDGKPYYQYALKGENPDISPRKVFLYDISLVSFVRKTYQAEAVITVRCSKGTYVRSLARDIAESMGTLGVVKDLCRVSIDSFSLSQAVTLETVRQHSDLRPYLF